MQVAGNIFGQHQWPLNVTGSSTNPAVNFSGAGQSGISYVSNTLSMHALGNTPLIITANGVNTTTMSVLTTPANVTPTPVIATTIQIADASGTVMDDLALDAANGGFLKIGGTGFGGGTMVSVGGMIATATTLVSTTQLIAQVQPRAAGTYPVTITRPDGPFFTVPTGISFSNFPAFSSSNLGNVFDTFTLSLVATSDSNVTYSNVSALPNTLTLASNGTLTGTVTNLTTDTVYSIQIKATDAEFQDTTQTFSLNARTLFGSPAGVFALRQILGYSGNVVQIRRSSDNALANIGFVANAFDISTLLTFTGANGNAYVQTWYDQSGLGNHMSQSNVNAQPGIVGMGQLVTENGRPALWFDGTRYLDGGDVLDLQANSVTTFTTARFRNESSSIQTLWQKSFQAAGAGRYGMYFLNNSVGVQALVDVNAYVAVTANVTAAYTSTNTYGMRYTRGSDVSIRVNGGTSFITANTVLMTANISQPFRLGAYTNNDSPSNTPLYFLQGTIQEHFHYFLAIDDERRNAMDANILKYSKPAAIVGTIATGGTVNTVGNVVTHTFTSNGTFVCSTQGNVEYLIVAGGGGGGGGTGGGGGGGGVLVGMCSVIANTYSVIVGAGGAGGSRDQTGSNGQNSTFNSLVAYGGGGGGANDSTITVIGNGKDGGCGGGATNAGNMFGTAGQGTPGLGFRGGVATSWTGNYGCGGGGGGGSLGVNGTTSAGGNGGIGFLSSISGTATYYAGGGAGGTFGGGTLGLGGLGGGGNAPAGNATANTGGGGGGQKDNLAAAGGNGGSGIVILRYSLVAQDVQGGIYSISSGYAYYTFRTSDTLYVRTAKTVDILVVAGGGAGGGGYGGGGGAGGVLLTENVSLSANTYSVVVGSGGTGTTGGAGGKGQNSTILSYVAIGGGGGGGNTFTGGNGGSGGGGGGYPGYSFAAGLGTAGQGTNGVTATSGVGGGGGGSGGTGSGLNGGPGALIWGTYYGGGGGGFSGSVGIGGGGGGGWATNTPNGTAGTGGGGGAWNGTATTSGIGGSGIVIVRFVL